MSNNQGGWKKILEGIHFLIDVIVLMILFLLALYGAYGIWDSHLLVKNGLSDQYEVYKPKERTESFQQLQAMNKDVIGWVEVYGTNIDYPIVQGKDDWQYINTNAKGEYSLTGALFLSERNKADFSDFNSIVYGHNMTPKIMFGNIKDFREKEFFDTHKYGDLFDGKKHYGIYFFSILRADAYDKSVYRVVEAGKDAYMQRLEQLALHSRDVDVSEGDRIILLSTCSNALTNGRDILVGKITEERYPNTFTEKEKSPVTLMKDNFLAQWNRLPAWAKVAACLGIAAILALLFWVISKRRRRRKQEV